MATVVEPSSATDVTFNYLMSLIPQLITIVAAIGAGFRFLQSHNDKRVKEMEGALLAKLQVERDFASKDMKEIHKSLESLNGHYRVITDFIKEELTRHEKMLDRLNERH